jgi:hypothetical protein
MLNYYYVDFADNTENAKIIIYGALKNKIDSRVMRSINFQITALNLENVPFISPLIMAAVMKWPGECRIFVQ